MNVAIIKNDHRQEQQPTHCRSSLRPYHWPPFRALNIREIHDRAILPAREFECKIKNINERCKTRHNNIVDRLIVNSTPFALPSLPLSVGLIFWIIQLQRLGICMAQVALPQLVLSEHHVVALASEPWGH
jgi:hypothetical protein